MIDNMYNNGGVYRFDKEKGKEKIYKIISNSTPKSIDKIFSENTFVDTPTGTYDFFINSYDLRLTWLLNEIYDFFELVKYTVFKKDNLMLTVDDEGIYYYVITMPVNDNDIRLILLDRKEEDCRNCQTRYKDSELKSTIVVEDIIVNRVNFAQQFYDEFNRIYDENKYYISEEYKQECAKDGSILCQEYVIQYLHETAQVLKNFLDGEEQ